MEDVLLVNVVVNMVSVVNPMTIFQYLRDVKINLENVIEKKSFPNLI